MFLLLLLAIPLIYYGVYFLFRGPKPAQPQVIAHRGGRAATPENTLKAFRNAIALGADWLETDVQRTRDGQLILFHDKTIDRLTDSSGNVADLTMGRIDTLNVGGERIPTFQELLKLAAFTQALILPEAKDPEQYPGIETEMVQAIHAANYQDKTVIQSFDHAQLERVRRLDPAIQVCPLYGLWQMSLSNVQPADAKYVCPMAEMILLNPWMVRQAHANGQQVFAYFGPLQSPLMMRVMLAIGVDGLMVDDPQTLLKMLKR